MKRVTGIGGVFICSENPERLKEWYKTHLGLDIQSWGGSLFRWNDNPQGTTTWSVFRQGTEYMKPAENKTFMINYRVDNLEALLSQLQREGVTAIGEMQVFDYGKFAWILDCDGNKIELWEPVDNAL